MSFIGMLRPLVKGNTSRWSGSTTPLALLLAGFALSSTLFFGLVYGIGVWSRVSQAPRWMAWLVAGSACMFFAIVDVKAVRARRLCLIGLQRQTPKALVYRYGPRRGAFMWGLDAGLGVTTFRVVASTWALLVLLVLGLAPWWLGIPYAVGFSIPIGVATLCLRWRSGDDAQEPQWITKSLSRQRHRAQGGCLAVLVLVSGVLAAGALLDLSAWPP